MASVQHFNAVDMSTKRQMRQNALSMYEIWFRFQCVRL